MSTTAQKVTTIIRATVSIALDDSHEDIKAEWSDQSFKPASVTTTYYMDDGDDDWKRYSMTVRGPRRLKSGSLSTTSSQSRTFHDRQRGMADLPEAIRDIVDANIPRSFA